MRNISLIFFLITLTVSCRERTKAPVSDVYYTCSMDPQVISDKPGDCPICHMELTAVKRNGKHETTGIQLSDQQLLLGNIRIDTIAPANMNTSLTLHGTIVADASKQSSVSARVTGRIDRLYVKTTGDFISRGAPLYELYSEELNNAKQEYIAALQRKELFRKQSVINFDDIIEGAANKLRLWGMSDKQIQSLEGSSHAGATTTFYSPYSGFITELTAAEGSYIMEGGSIAGITDLSSLWVETEIYASQWSSLPEGGKVNVRIPDAGIETTGRVVFTDPELKYGNGVNVARIAITNPQNKLSPGMAALVEIKSSGNRSIQLPADAVIREKKGATVWIRTRHNTFQSRMVETGAENNGSVEILNGLDTGDVVVVSGAYLLNSEYIFKRGPDPMSSHNH